MFCFAMMFDQCSQTPTQLFDCGKKKKRISKWLCRISEHIVLLKSLVIEMIPFFCVEVVVSFDITKKRLKGLHC